MMKLTNAQWELLEPYFPREHGKNPQGGRPGYSNRALLQGVLWVMRTGARWNDLEMPKGYPSGSTCYRHFRKWVELGIFDKIIRALVEDLRKRGKIDLTETFIDATFVEAKKGARKFGKTKSGKGSKIMAIVDRRSLPIALLVESASPHESTLALPTLRSRYTRHVPDRIIGDKAYDSDPLRRDLKKRHRCQLIAPHKSNRKKPPTQDGRALRRYRRRWVVERFFAWIQSFRRVETRYERYPQNYFAFVELASICILLRRF
ncbi:MAG: IS5 family transposase [Bdellovibrionales bacterium]|nr:IS5 family transposase [Bdellovibrionales bacterium]